MHRAIALLAVMATSLGGLAAGGDDRAGSDHAARGQPTADQPTADQPTAVQSTAVPSEAVPSGAVRHLRTDLLVVGGTESGWAAAIQAARMGVKRITLVHDGRWLGGQFTEQALACVDENKGVGKVGWGVDWHPMKRSFHRSGLFRELMQAIEAFNTTAYGQPMPGRPFHGPSTFRPAEAEAIFRKLLQPSIDSGQLQLILNKYPVAADVTTVAGQRRLVGLSFAPLESDVADLHVAATVTIDASDWGEAIQVSGAAYECGPDPRSRYGEPSAPEILAETSAAEMNPITWAMVVEQPKNRKQKLGPIDRPSRFDDRNFVRTSRLSLNKMRDLEWDRPVKLGSILHWPDRGRQQQRQLSVYNVRRIVEGETSRQGRTVVLLNYMLGQDYPLERLPQHVIDALEKTAEGASKRNIVRMTRAQREIVFADARRHSLSLLYHLQAFVHDSADDTANSFRHFVLSDEFGTADRLPPKPYIRESLRLKAMYMMREQDGRNVDGETKTAARERFAQVMYPDGVLCWQFHYDFHRTGRAYLRGEGNRGPWVDFEKPGRHTHHMSDRSLFPLRSLIPQQMDGLIGAQKNVGYSSIVCAAIRLHDQCIAIGQAAGATAAVALRNQISPRRVAVQRDRLEQVRDGLCGGTEGSPLLLWPFRDLAPSQQGFVAINRLAARGIVANDTYEVDFQPTAAAAPGWKRRMLQLAQERAATELEMPEVSGQTRGEFCVALWKRVQATALRRPNSIGLGNADDDDDHDGIRNRDDPTPWTAGPEVRWAVLPSGPMQDGVPNPLGDDLNVNDALLRVFNFGPGNKDSAAATDFDVGEKYNPEIGYGWTVSNTHNGRKRNVRGDQPSDTFLFTRDRAEWQCDVANGRWLVTVCVGDAAHDQPGQRVSVEGQRLIDGVATSAGRFHEASVEVEVTDGRLTIGLGPQRAGENSCLNWLRLVPRPIIANR